MSGLPKEYLFVRFWDYVEGHWFIPKSCKGKMKSSRVSWCLKNKDLLGEGIGVGEHGQLSS